MKLFSVLLLALVAAQDASQVYINSSNMKGGSNQNKSTNFYILFKFYILYNFY